MKKQFVVGLVTLVVAAVTQLGFVAHASVNDFVIKDFKADYYLDKDDSGRSVLKTVESITAEFPQIDQNHGIERAIPTRYDNHTVNLDLQSVKDPGGSVIEYTTYDQNDNLVVRIGSADTYVHGLHTYVLTYAQRDVTKYFDDTKLDEFYWDTNGVGWSQSFDKVTATIHIGSKISSSLSGAPSCFFGLSGSTNKCDVTISGSEIKASITQLKPGENLTMVVGFKPQTFKPYEMSVGDFVNQYQIYIAAFVAVALLTVIFLLKLKKGKDSPGRGIIVPEYLPPKGIDVALSSVIVGASTTWASAIYVDLAVRHKLKIIEQNSKGSKDPSYSMELVNTGRLSDTEILVVEALFGVDPQVGAIYDLDKNKTDTELARALTKIYGGVKKTAKADGYYRDVKKLKKQMGVIAAMIFAIVFVNPYVGITGGVIAIIIIGITNPLSEKGRALLDYLDGLKRYIKVAEEDRIKVLQSPQGADKTPVDTNDTRAVLHLYERVLPYAVLFKNEKEWTKVLGKYYEQNNTSPDWYSGNAAFNAVYFSSAISNFSTTATSNSYVSSSSSSSGGGFSGGGGGGGGGGGW